MFRNNGWQTTEQFSIRVSNHTCYHLSEIWFSISSFNLAYDITTLLHSAHQLMARGC